MSEEVIVTGLDELQRALNLMATEAIKASRPAVKAGAEVIRAEMVAEAPKRTGLLAEHFDVRTRKQSGEAGAVAAFVGPNSKVVIHPQEKGETKGLPRTARFIAKLLEFGGHRQAKNPFMTRSFEASKTTALEALTATLREQLKRRGLI